MTDVFETCFVRLECLRDVPEICYVFDDNDFLACINCFFTIKQNQNNQIDKIKQLYYDKSIEHAMYFIAVSFAI